MLSEQPLFSVIVPVYNHERYIAAALDSLLAQTCDDWEAIIVNDGSIDGTATIIEQYASRDPRFRVIHKTNGGVSSALNAGMRQMRGAWMCWLSSDDLYAPDKLSLHREWIGRFPEARFFCTDSSELENETGVIRDGGDWSRPPEPQWQILEMMRRPFVHGNSVCVKVSLSRQAGEFNESLRYAQDYDYWLRLLRLEPVVHIPRRTCITRWHSGQVTSSFPEACLLETARVILSALETSNFPMLVPWADLSRVEEADSAIRLALTLTANPGAFLYGLGPHPILLNRIQEWIWNESPLAWREKMKRRFLRELSRMYRRQENPVLRFFLNAGLAFGRTWQGPFPRCDLPVTWITSTWHQYLAARQDDRAKALNSYSERCLGASLKPPPDRTNRLDVALVVNQKHVSVSADVKYGSGRAAIELVKSLRRSGVVSASVGRTAKGMEFSEGEWALGAPTEEALRALLQAFEPVDALVGVSRSDIIRMADARRYLVYWHDPSPLGLDERLWLALARIPVVCVSEYSARVQRQAGFPAAFLHVALNGYDAAVFNGDIVSVREPHSLVFAGMVADYKGVDTVLRAFQEIRETVPDATLTLYGRTVEWPVVPPKLRLCGWFNATGLPVWSVIEKQCPGLRYAGEVPPSVLARALSSSAILVMPSRVAESFGLVSLEAQACGCIPVLPRSGGFPETMLENETGYLYEGNTAGNLARVILTLWREERPSQEQRIKAQKWVSAQFSWKRTGERVLEVLDTVASAQGLRMRLARQMVALCTFAEAAPAGRTMAWRWQKIMLALRGGRPA